VNIAYLGSCLSALVVKAFLAQNPGTRLVGALQHMRADRLHESWIRKDGGFPTLAEVAGILKQLQQHDEANRNGARLRSQTQEALERFQSAIGSADCLVFDANYDLSARLWSVQQGEATWQLANLQVRKELKGFTSLGYAGLAGLRTVYQGLFEHLRQLNPALKIVFLQYPVSGFERVDAVERVERARALAEQVAGMADVLHLPLVEIDRQNLSEKGPLYFSQRVYEAYARAVRKMLDGEPAPSWLRNGVEFAELAAWVGLGAAEAGDAEPAGDERPGVNPYHGLPGRQFWKPAVSDRYPLQIDGLYDGKYRIGVDDRIATFGSCFAQHIGRRLKASGFNYMDLEPAPKELPAREHAAHGFGIYSARYGNVYTSLQMLQLFQQAFGEIECTESWQHNGRHHDPLRPNIFPGGFESADAMLAERARHLALVRRLFEQSDVIVFTMGLTECWYNLQTGLAYPLAPGATVGSFDPQLHGFRNLTYEEIVAQMTELLGRLRSVNPRARLLLTVSPVPLTATYEKRHVIVSTVESKSVLRAAAGALAARNGHVDYFPSYEIITSAPFKSMFYKSNLRNIWDEGVDFVMTHFFRVHTAGASARGEEHANECGDEFCDEVFLELDRRVET